MQTALLHVLYSLRAVDFYNAAYKRFVIYLRKTKKGNESNKLPTKCPMNQIINWNDQQDRIFNMQKQLKWTKSGQI